MDTNWADHITDSEEESEEEEELSQQDVAQPPAKERLWRYQRRRSRPGRPKIILDCHKKIRLKSTESQLVITMSKIAIQ